MRPGVSIGSLYSLANGNGAKLGAIHGPIRIAEEWGIEEDLWDRNWSSLSGGESQRIALAVAVGLQGAEVLLLDGTLLHISGCKAIILDHGYQSRHRRWTQRQWLWWKHISKI